METVLAVLALFLGQGDPVTPPPEVMSEFVRGLTDEEIRADLANAPESLGGYIAEIEND